MPHSPTFRARAIVAVLVTVAAVVNAVTGSTAAAYPTANVDLDGHGFGHGRGMGQYGALGYAVDHGWNYRQILGHFYSNTAAGDIGNPEVTVILRSFDERHTLVQQERGHMTTNAADGTFPALRARRTGANTFAVDRGPHCGGPWTEIRSGMQGPVIFRPQNRNEDRQEMLQVCEPDGDLRWLRGEIRSVERNNGTQGTVNALDMQSYLRGVVPRESPASWGDLGGGAGMHALRAQAVAARSYAWAENQSAYARTCDTDACQVYGGRAVQNSGGFRDLEDGRSDRAVAETVGEVRTLNGAAARTEFSSSTGGYSAGGTFPAVIDEGDDISLNPLHNWRDSIPVVDIQNRYGVGTLNAVRVTRRNGLGDFGGRALDVQIEGSSRTVTVSGWQFRNDFDLFSDWFAVRDPGGQSPPTTAAPAPTPPPPSGPGGYWVAGRDGSVYAFGDARHLGSMAGTQLVLPVVGMTSSASGNGYWMVANDGGVFSFGDAPFRGSMGGRPLDQPVNGMASTPDNGYWLVASDGGIFSFGPPFYGSMGGTPLVQPVVGMAATPSGNGYWMVAADGGIFSFGGAQFHGSMGGRPLDRPMVGMASTASGNGYWTVAADGGIFSFGDARFHGSMGGRPLDQPVVGMARTPTGNGYWLVAADGGIFSFGDAQFFGSAAGQPGAKAAMAVPRR